MDSTTCRRSNFTLGDYLAALISSDSRAWPADDYHYREALIASFRARGLLPQGATSATEDGLRWLVDSWRRGRRRSTRSRSARLPNVQLKRPAPDRRSLKTFAFDPSAGRSIGNLLAVRIPYEPLKPGPIGQQVAVIDFDASNERYYPSVDLERAEILETGGLDPTDVDPRFHQQMVYAVVVSTARALPDRARAGRSAGRGPVARQPARWADRLRIYPHAMQEANAYYERNLRGLLFGYFEASRENPGRNLPGQIVYTCLSADIVAHETTHALLDSVQPHFLEKTSADAPAFHEAIADVVALLGHFSYDDALLDTIQRTGGLIQRDLMNPDAAPTDDLGRVSAERSRGNPLVQLALQFGESLGNRAALRSALGRQPDPRELERAFEAHDRGAILVAAIFDAFFSIYLRRVADLLRIGRASGAISPTGDIHQDLAKRLAKEASDTAVRVSSIAARALDFCPPVDITFGDYLRALVTADYERTHDDPLGFRAAFIDGFLERGIYPAQARSMTEEALRWKPWEASNGGRAAAGDRPGRLRDRSGRGQDQRHAPARIWPGASPRAGTRPEAARPDQQGPGFDLAAIRPFGHAAHRVQVPGPAAAARPARSGRQGVAEIRVPRRVDGGPQHQRRAELRDRQERRRRGPTEPPA